MIGNTGAEVIFGVNDLATTKEISERFGDTTVSAVTQQRPRFWSGFQWNKQSEAEHMHRRPYMLPQEVARKKRDEQIILRAGMSPIICKRQASFNDPELAVLRVDPPEIPRVTWDVAMDDGQTRLLRKRPRNIGGMSQEDLEEAA